MTQMASVIGVATVMDTNIYILYDVVIEGTCRGLYETQNYLCRNLS
jgi:hypothetical protein